MKGDERLKCSIWNNGQSGWGLRVLGGPGVRQANFRRDINPVTVEIDGIRQQFNVDKKSFWTRTCGELIGKPIREWKERHGIESGQHVWLRVVDPYRHFQLEIR